MDGLVPGVFSHLVVQAPLTGLVLVSLYFLWREQKSQGKATRLMLEKHVEEDKQDHASQAREMQKHDGRLIRIETKLEFSEVNLALPKNGGK